MEVTIIRKVELSMYEQKKYEVIKSLAGITTIDAANEFLNSYIKEFNEKFSLPIHGSKSVFETQPSDEKINLILAVLNERTVDCGHSIQFHHNHYRMLDKNGKQVHYRKGTKVMTIQAFDGSLFCCVNDRDIYALEQIPEHEEKSRELDADYQKPKEKKQYIPPMNHPWRRESFKKHVAAQPHHYDDKISA